MSARKTSIEVYREIEASGLLSKMRFAVYKVVYRHGPITISEAFKILQRDMPGLNWNTRTRFTELRDCGVLRETGTRTCKVTGRTVIEWAVTDGLPTKKPKRARGAAAEVLENTIQQLRREIKSLQQDNDRLNSFLGNSGQGSLF